MDINRLLLGAAFSAVIGGLGYWRKALSGSGVLGAIVTGTLIFGLAGIVWGLVLIAFFVSSSMLSHYRSAQKAHLADKFEKGQRRDLGQTLANGGWGAMLAVLVALVGRESQWYPILAFGYFGTMAAVNSDTWATELGVLSAQQPRLITTGQTVEVGASGGVTLQGTLSALGGSAFVAVCAFLLIQGASLLTTRRWLLSDWFVIPVVTLAGFGGSLLDSLLGATVQRIYSCQGCHKETERRQHCDGRTVVVLRGWPWLNNDMVNLLSSVAASLVAALVAWPFLR
jgi:uncharacterized protein (TIGR00297 family)